MGQRKRNGILLAILLTTALVVTAANATILNPSKYRLASGGIGNVIFSSGDLPIGEDDTYTDIRDTFIHGEDTTINARCYFAKTYGEIWDDIQDLYPGADFISGIHKLSLTREWQGAYETFSGEIDIEKPTKDDWDQVKGYAILPSYFNLIDIAERGAEVQGTHKVTYTVSVRIGMEWSTLLNDYGRIEDVVISEGTFDYVVK